MAKLGNWAFLRPVPESQSYSIVLKPSVPTDYTLLFWSCLVLWEAALYGLHQNLSFRLVSSWVLSMQGGKRIKLGYLVPCLPVGSWNGYIPQQRWSFPNNTLFQGCCICPFLHPFRVTLPFQERDRVLVQGWGGPRVQEWSGHVLLSTFLSTCLLSFVFPYILSKLL